MLKTFRADLHVHTCLSPCCDDEMRPSAIVTEAKNKALQVIAVCDHNSTGNVRAVRQAGRREDLAVIGGIEVCSEEEVHVLGLFDGETGLGEMQQLIDENLPGWNDPELFGRQCLCVVNDAVVDLEDRLLIGATKLTVEKIVEKIHSLGGLAIASHVDREAFGILSQLGFVPEGLEIDAVEISPLRSVSEARARFPAIEDYPTVCSSDAHRLTEIGTVCTTFTGVVASVKDLKKALLGLDGRAVLN